MHLNQLYGYFGRRKTLLETVNVYKKDLNKYYGKYTVYSELDINKYISTLLISSNLDYELLNEINQHLDQPLKCGYRKVNSHVGIASAVTSYGRIEMMKYKIYCLENNIKIYYTDTDSIFIDKELPKNMVGDDLGLMKDELSGGYIKQAYFLGINKYCYIDNNDKVNSVFSGVERNSLSWDEIIKISEGGIVIKQGLFRFYKNFKQLSINIKTNIITTIQFNPLKRCVNNFYLPIKI
jgi:hypothetical protein